MKIIVNGREANIETTCSITELLEKLGYSNHLVAVAKNQVHIKRTEYTSTFIQQDDQIEILAPMAGG